MAKDSAGKPKLYRAKKITILPPGKLSFSALLKPDDKFGDASFYANIEYDEHGLDRLAETLQAEFGFIYSEFKKEYAAGWDAEQAKIKDPAKRQPFPEMGSLSSWQEDKVKQPNDEKYLPFMKFSVKAEGKDRDGETFVRSMVIWDLKNNKLDLAKLRLGRGSIVQPVVKCGLYMTALVKQPTPTLQLQGLRVLKLVQFGAGQDLDEVNPEDVEGLEMDTDLSAFAASTGRVKDADEVEDDASPF